MYYKTEIGRSLNNQSSAERGIKDDRQRIIDDNNRLNLHKIQGVVKFVIYTVPDSIFLRIQAMFLEGGYQS